MTAAAPTAPVVETQSVADLLTAAARDRPAAVAVRTPRGRAGDAHRAYDELTFVGLDADASRVAAALHAAGVRKGERVALMVRPGGAFAAVVFGVLRAGAAAVLIDPGLGARAVLRCLREVEPVAFVGEPAAVHVARAVGRLRGVRAWAPVRGAAWGRFLAGGTPDFAPPPVARTDAAAVIFTSGSTGPAKGVAYEHGMFLAQIDLLRAGYGLGEGESDVPAFPLFALFDVGLRAAMTVPRMHPAKPAEVLPEEILGPIRQFAATRAFGSPALWNRVLRHAAERGETLPGVKRLLSAGAPVSPRTHEWARAVLPAGAELHTPYGATEALPVCTTGTDEVLGETAARTREGAGTCVGRPFPGVTVRVIAAGDDPIARITDARDLPPGEVGEVIVSSPSVTREYVGRPEQTRRAKIADPAAPGGVWHRMGDVGYLDGRGRLWFCGRQAHVVHHTDGPVYPVRAEAVLNEHPAVHRTAVVGVGPRGSEAAVAVAELDGTPDRERVRGELFDLAKTRPASAAVSRVLFHRRLPTDVRHNTKIDRTALAGWATKMFDSPWRRRLTGA